MGADSPRRASSRLVRIGMLIAWMPIGTALGASYRTANFVVEAPTVDAARKVGDRAEACRKSVARAWLGRELPTWKGPCSIRVRLSGGEAGGETTFGFDRSGVSDQTMTVFGRLDRILASSLPHEVTHTIFAAYFRGPMPRWADEGASVLSEDRRETRRHDQIAAELIDRRGELPLGRLFRMDEYPRDPTAQMGFYGQGYSVSRFLIEMGGRARFLRFVRDGTRSGWDAAARDHYGLADVQELDRAWRSWHAVLVDNRRTPAPAPLVVRVQAGSEEPGE